MLTSLPSMEKVRQVDPQGIRDGQGILQVPQRMTFILVTNLGERGKVFLNMLWKMVGLTALYY